MLIGEMLLQREMKQSNTSDFSATWICATAFSFYTDKTEVIEPSRKRI